MGNVGDLNARRSDAHNYPLIWRTWTVLMSGNVFWDPGEGTPRLCFGRCRAVKVYVLS